MDLSAFGNIKKQVDYVREQYAKIDFDKVTLKDLKNPPMFQNMLRRIESGRLFSGSVLCHLHPGTMVYDQIVSGKSQTDAKYRSWMKDFDSTARKNCKDSTPIEYRGMDFSTRMYYQRQTEKALKAIDCKKGDYACLRKHLRKIPIRYAVDIALVAELLGKYVVEDLKPPCDKTCQDMVVLKSTQTFITFLSHYDRSKLASTMDWKKFPEEKYRTITEDVDMYFTIIGNLGDVLEELGKLDAAKITDEGLKSELKSIGKDVSDFVSGKMFKDSVICTMDPWTAAYDKFMTPYKVPKKNKKFEQRFLTFKEKVCK
jgi:hypothetical protein